MEALKKAGELGFGAIYCSEEFGGSGLSRLDASVIFEQLGAGMQVCNWNYKVTNSFLGDLSTAAYISVHNMVFFTLEYFGGKHTTMVIGTLSYFPITQFFSITYVAQIFSVLFQFRATFFKTIDVLKIFLEISKEGFGMLLTLTL